MGMQFGIQDTRQTRGRLSRCRDEHQSNSIRGNVGLWEQASSAKLTIPPAQNEKKRHDVISNQCVDSPHGNYNNTQIYHLGLKVIFLIDLNM